MSGTTFSPSCLSILLLTSSTKIYQFLPFRDQCLRSVSPLMGIYFILIIAVRRGVWLRSCFIDWTHTDEQVSGKARAKPFLKV
jgi:hypothetical protein